MSQSESSSTVIIVVAVVLLVLLLPCVVGAGLAAFWFLSEDLPQPAPAPPVEFAIGPDERATGATVDVVRRIAAAQMGVDVDEIGPATSLHELGADELDMVELVMSLEDEFQVSIPDEKIIGDTGGELWSENSKNLTMSRLAEIVEQQRALAED